MRYNLVLTEAGENDARLSVIVIFFLPLSVRVYSELKQVTDNLKHPRFQFTENEEEADIIWACSHIRDYRWVCGSHKLRFCFLKPSADRAE